MLRTWLLIVLLRALSYTRLPQPAQLLGDFGGLTEAHTNIERAPVAMLTEQEIRFARRRRRVLRLEMRLGGAVLGGVSYSDGEIRVADGTVVALSCAPVASVNSSAWSPCRTLPVAVGLDAAAGHLEHAIWTIPAHHLLAAAPQTARCIAFVAVE